MCRRPTAISPPIAIQATPSISRSWFQPPLPATLGTLHALHLLPVIAMPSIPGSVHGGIAGPPMTTTGRSIEHHPGDSGSNMPLDLLQRAVFLPDPNCHPDLLLPRDKRLLRLFQSPPSSSSPHSLTTKIHPPDENTPLHPLHPIPCLGRGADPRGVGVLPSRDCRGSGDYSGRACPTGRGILLQSEIGRPS